MSLVQVVRVLLRHWLVLLLGLMLTVGATAAAFAYVPSTYTATSVVMLLQQSDPKAPGGGNPYLTMDGSLKVTGEALQRAVTDDPLTTAGVLAVDPAATFEIFPVLSGPFLQVTTEASTAAGALEAESGVRARLTQTLERLQTEAGAPAASQIGLTDVSRPGKPETLLTRKVQLVAAVAAVGLMLTTSLTFLLERVQSSRRRAIRARQEAAAAAAQASRLLPDAAPPAGGAPRSEAQNSLPEGPFPPAPAQAPMAGPARAVTGATRGPAAGEVPAQAPPAGASAAAGRRPPL